MKTHRRSSLAFLLSAAALLTACDSDPTGIGLDDPAMAVLVGTVQLAGGGGATATDLSGVQVHVEGGSSSDTTDENGLFRLEARADNGRVRLRFQRGTVDVSLELSGVTPGALLQLTVRLSDDSASVAQSSSSDRDEFEGAASFAGLSGSAPTRTLTLSVQEIGRLVVVDVLEASTAFESDGDLVTFDQLLARVEAVLEVKVEGDGTPTADGRIAATLIKAETEDDDDDDDEDDDGEDDDEDFDGDLTELSVIGNAPTRIVRVTLQEEAAQFVVDITEGTTTFDNEGDLVSVESLLSAHAAGTPIEIEGDGDLGQDGVFVATVVKVETDDDNDSPTSNSDQCRGVIGAVTVAKVVVPAGATCTLDGTRVQSDVEVERGATLIATAIDVGGDVEADEPASVSITNASTVGGDVEIEDGGAGTVANSTIGGDLEMKENRGAQRAEGNVIVGSLKAEKNTGGIAILQNNIGQELRCKENQPAPTGGGNTAASKGDQCAGL